MIILQSSFKRALAVEATLFTAKLWNGRVMFSATTKQEAVRLVVQDYLNTPVDVFDIQATTGAVLALVGESQSCYPITYTNPKTRVQTYFSVEVLESKLLVQISP